MTGIRNYELRIRDQTLFPNSCFLIHDSMKRERLDAILLKNGFVQDKKGAFIAVTEGRVFIDGQKAISPAQLVGEGAKVEVKSADGYVGRGAYKLEAALEKFAIDPAGKICVDIGAATGGFTEVLLRRGAAKVYAIDTARGKLALKIRQDSRAVVMEQTDVRDLKSLPDHADIAVIDVSLISLRDILASARPHATGGVGVNRLLKPDGVVVALFKPQYETRDLSILHHGVIRDPADREKLVEDFAAWAARNNWGIKNKMESPIRGDKGNGEYLLQLTVAGKTDSAYT